MSGVCTYYISDTTYTIEVRGSLTPVKAWKIRQVLRGKNSDPCEPLVVKADRTYLVVQNEASPLILSRIAFTHCYVDNSRISSENNLCKRPQAMPKYEHFRSKRVPNPNP